MEEPGETVELRDRSVGDQELKHEGSTDRKSFMEWDDSKEGETTDSLQAAREYMSQHTDITIEHNGNQLVWLANDADAQLYRQVREFKEQNPKATQQEASKEFIVTRALGFRSNVDAFIRILYNSRHVDYVLKAEDETHAEIRAAYERKLVQAGLVLELQPCFDPRHTYVKIYAPFSLISREAERQRVMVTLKVNPDDPLAKPLSTQEDEGVDVEEVEEDHKTKQDVLKALDARHAEVAKGLKGVAHVLKGAGNFFDPDYAINSTASARFKLENIEKFAGGTDYLPTYGTESKEKVVHNFFAESKRNLLTYSIIARTVLSPGDVAQIKHPRVNSKHSVGVTHLVKYDAYSKFYPLHDGGTDPKKHNPKLRAWLNANWAKKPWAPQPLDSVRDYFGEKIALYFAFIGYYTYWLFPMALLGIACFAYGVKYAIEQVGETGTALTLAQLNNLESTVGLAFDNAATLPFSALICIWATLFIEFWKRKNAYLAWWWDVVGYEESDTPRPEWYGTRIRVSPVTNKKEYYYPVVIQRFKIAASVVSVASGVLFVIVSVMGTVTYTAWSNNYFGACNITAVEYTACILNRTIYDNNNNTVVYDCSDGCYNFSTSETCNNNTFAVSNVTFSSCMWYTVEGTTPRCGPGCLNVTNGVPCLIDPFDQADGLSRTSCSWQDQYYIGDITASILNLFVIVVMNKVFQYLSGFLNEWENHRTQTEWENALIVKTFFFQFLNSYTTLFYIAFFKGTLAGAVFGQEDLHDFCEYGSCFNELMIQLVIIFLGKQFVNQLFEIFLPLARNIAMRKYNQKRLAKIQDSYKRRLRKNSSLAPYNEKTKDIDVPQWILDDELAPYDGVLFDDYNEVAQQFGFITLFVAAFPLAPLFALLNNIFEIRTDAYKNLNFFQRPPALQSRNIGTWESIINVMGVICVITNSFVVAFTSQWALQTITDLSETKGTWEILASRLILVLIFEHVVIGAKVAFAFAIPDIPATVKIAMEREKYRTRLALENLAELPEAEGDADDVIDGLFQTVQQDVNNLGKRARTQLNMLSGSPGGGPGPEKKPGDSKV